MNDPYKLKILRFRGGFFVHLYYSTSILVHLQGMRDIKKQIA